MRNVTSGVGTSRWYDISYKAMSCADASNGKSLAWR